MYILLKTPLPGHSGKNRTVFMVCLSRCFARGATGLGGVRGADGSLGLFTGTRSFRLSATSNGDQLSCDLLVVGAGTGGSAIANKFASGGKLKVTVIEPSDVSDN